jgi:tetratricopeptide (TPR) repeat protein
MVFVADDLAAWLVGLFADAGRRRLTTWVLGTDQERALRSAATTAVQVVGEELCPDDDDQAMHVALVISQVFGEPGPGLAPLAENATLLEALQAGIARRLAPLGDSELTGTGQSSAEVLGISETTLAQKLTDRLIREIVVQGAQGGPLAPLATQLNHDKTHLQGKRIEDILEQRANKSVAAPPRDVWMPKVHDWDPHHLKVHQSITIEFLDKARLEGLPDMPTYVVREVDRDLRQEVREASEHSGVILLIGQSCMGKTRSAYEAVLAELPDWCLFHPSNAAEVSNLLDYGLPQTGVIIWLDEAQEYLAEADGLTIATVRSLLSAERPAVLLMTMWPAWYEELSAPAPSPTPGLPMPLDRHKNARQILDLARKIHIDGFNAMERRRAKDLAALDPRIQAALDDPHYSPPQVLAAAPELVRRWKHSSNSYGAALISAALDYRQIGIEGPLREPLLREVAPAYLSARDRSLAPSDWFKRGMTYACLELKGATAALLPVPGPGIRTITGYTVAEYLRQYSLTIKEPTTIPDDIWGAVLRHVSLPDDLYRAGLKAAQREVEGYAESLFNRVIETSTDPSQKVLAGYARRDLVRLLLRQHRSQDAVAIARDAVNAGDSDARSNLAFILEVLGRHEEALDVAKWPTDADPGDWDTLSILLSRGREFDKNAAMLLKAVVAGDASAAFSLERELKRQGRADEMIAIWRRMMIGGHRHARTALADLLLTLDRDDEALAVLREGIALGESAAWSEYLDALYELQRYDEAIAASYEAEAAGETFNTIRVALLLHLSGRATERIEELRQAVMNGEIHAEIELMTILHDSASEYAHSTNQGSDSGFGSYQYGTYIDSRPDLTEDTFSPFDGMTISETVHNAMRHAAALRRPGGPPLDTRAVLIALMHVDAFGDWSRIWLNTRSAETVAQAKVRDPAERAGGNWEGNELTYTLTKAISTAVQIARQYSLEPMPVGVFALGLIANPAAAAARSLGVGGEVEHGLLVDLIQETLIGGDLADLDLSRY